MKKFYRIFILIIILVFLSTFNPNKFEINLKDNKSFFEIKKITISNNLLVNEDEILLKLKEVYGKNIFLIQRKDIEESLENVNFLRKIEVNKKYPDTVKVKIFETKPIGIVFKDKNQYLLDSSSNLIELSNEIDFVKLPNIIGEGAENNIIEFLKQLETNQFPVNNIKNFYYFKIQRWDLELLDNKIIKLPYNVSSNIIKKAIKLLNRKDFQNYKIIDLRIDGKIIVE